METAGLNGARFWTRHDEDDGFVRSGTHSLTVDRCCVNYLSCKHWQWHSFFDINQHKCSNGKHRHSRSTLAKSEMNFAEFSSLFWLFYSTVFYRHKNEFYMKKCDFKCQFTRSTSRSQFTFKLIPLLSVMLLQNEIKSEFYFCICV